MSVNRSRKSKLVPRVYVHLNDEDSTDLSEVKPKKKKKLLDDSDDLSSNSQPSFKPPMELSIKVEVEEFDEDFDFEDANIDPIDIKDENCTAASNSRLETSNMDHKESEKQVEEMKNKNVSRKKFTPNILKSKETDYTAVPESQPSTSNQVKSYSICQNKGAFLQNIYDMSHRTARLVKQCKIPIEVILEDLEDLSKTTVTLADKVLEVEMRNAWGRVRYERHVPSEVDVLIFNALIKWRDWTLISTKRDSPLIYKCYICFKAWWNLFPFQEHIVKHLGGEQELKVNIEVNYHVAHLVAFYGNKHRMYDIDMDTDCWRCGKSFDVHKVKNRDSGVFYLCKNCPNRAFLCTESLSHEGICPERRKTLSTDQLLSNCNVCKVVFFSEDDLNNHMVNAHRVRSDCPMADDVKSCPSCGDAYIKKNMHSCPVKKKNYPCVYCMRRFSSPSLLRIHIKSSSRNASCRICHMKLQSKCMEMSHVVIHSKNYKLMYKCILCMDENILFFDETSIKKHHTIVHMMKYDKRRFYCEMVIVSERCIKQHTVEQLDIVASTNGQIQIVAKPNNENEETNSEDITYESKMAHKTKATNCKAIESYIIKTENVENDQSPNETDDASNDEPVQIKVENVDDEIEDSLNEFHVNKLIKNENTESFGYEDLLSSVFQASKHIDTAKMLAKTAVQVKQEPVDDEYFEDDIIILTNSSFESDTVKLEPDSPHSLTNEASTSKSVSKISPNNKRERRIVRQTYRCSKCDQIFNRLKLYLIHFKVHGLANKSCPECKAVFSNHSRLGVHIKTHLNGLFVREKVLRAKDGEGIEEFQMKCTKCNKLVVAEDNFQHWDSHLDIGETEDIQFEDETLEESKDNVMMDMTESSLAVSVVEGIIDTLTKKSIYSPKKHINRFCEMCNHTFARVQGYKRHLIEHLLMDARSYFDQHTGLKCQICNKVLPKSHQFRIHVRDNHTDLPVYKCDLCKKNFSDSSNYSKHKKTHNFNLFQCDICMKRFHNIGSMRKHLESHENSEPITCKCCNKVFYSDSLYKKHMRSKEKREDKYPCKLCMKKFQTLKQQWDHLWVTHKIRRQKADCPICNASFRKYMDVKTHLRETHGVHDKNLSLITKMLFKDKKKSNDNVDEEEVENEEGDKEELLIVYDDG